jgi:hypothetical protein
MRNGRLFFGVLHILLELGALGRLPLKDSRDSRMPIVYIQQAVRLIMLGAMMILLQHLLAIYGKMSQGKLIKYMLSRHLNELSSVVY